MLAYRTLLCIGDLSRYKEQLKKQKNWRLSKFAYISAVKFMPSNGNAYNQLAVVNYNSGDDSDALIMYMKAYFTIAL